MKAAKSIGTERVLLALSETVPGVAPPEHLAEIGSAQATSRYVETGELGRGGLGVVMEALDEDLRRTVALKRPRAEPVAEGTAAIVREAQITAQLEHPNVPAIHSLGIDADGRAFFTMTRLHGRTLADVLAAEKEPGAPRMSLLRRLRIAQQVGAALAVAHARGVVHRDVKPHNVMLGDLGEVRLVDWGIARLGAGLPGPEEIRVTTSAEDATVAGSFIGTPGYASPEQVQGVTDLDARADVYSLGAVLYEMLAGRPPVVGDNVTAIIDDTLAGRVPDLKKLAPVHEVLAAIVHKALRPNREERYASVRELLEDLEAFEEGRRVSAFDECPIHLFGRWYRSRSPAVARLRNIDVDLIAWCCMFVGIPLGVAIAHWAPAWALPATITSLLLAALTAIRPAYTLFRRRRPDDPVGVLAATTIDASTQRPGTRREGERSSVRSPPRI